MPELPDVEGSRRHLEETAVGKTIAGVLVRREGALAGLSADAFADQVRGRRLERTCRHGKHLLVGMDDGRWLTVHFGMTGVFEYLADETDDPEYDRIRFDFAGGGHLAYVNRRMLGRIGTADDADAFIRSEGLGPDALDPALDQEAFSRAMAGRRRAVKVALTDQSVVAGIGNIYADEILFQARIDPEARADRLDAPRLRTLFAKMREVLQTAVDCGAGSERFVDRLPAGYLLPHREKGGTCPRCGAGIETRKLGGRTTYLCARCQDGR